MGQNISQPVMEWLLAGWAGYESRPEDVFPDLCDHSTKELADQLALTILAARSETVKDSTA